MRHEKLVDARVLFYTLKNLHKPREYRLRKLVARMGDDFEGGELDFITWIYGISNLADVLTNNNVELSGRIHEMFASGLWDARIERKWKV